MEDFFRALRTEEGPGRPALGLRDPATRALLFLVFLLQLFALSGIEGYQLADSVEYLDRAQSVARGQGLVGTGSVRSFAFSALFVPLFFGARILEVEHSAAVVGLARAMQMGLGLFLVLVVARMSTRHFGRAAGLAAGLLIGTNPLFLRFSVSPVSGVAAALALALALDALLERGDARRSLRGGLWLGAALLMAYQTLLVSVPFLFLLLVRDRKSGLRPWCAAVLGVAAGALVQCILDAYVFGAFGISLWRYLLENVIPVFGRLIAELGMTDAARAIYQFQYDLRGWGDLEISSGAASQLIRQRQPPLWYVTHFPELVVWPALVVLFLGLAAALRRRRFVHVALVALLLIDLAVMSTKGSKSFRLWLPLLPLLAPLLGQGYAVLRHGGVHPAGRSPPWRRVLAIALLVAAVAASLRELSAAPLRTYSPYWRAAAWVDAHERAAGRTSEDPARLASAFHWAVFQRTGAAVELARLPDSIDRWDRLDGEERAGMLEALSSVDWFIAHLPALTRHLDLFSELNQRFSVAAGFYDHDAHAALGPVLVLSRGTAEPGARRFFETETLASVEGVHDYRRALGLPPSVRFADGSGEVTLLGYEYQPLPGDGERAHGWLTYHWHARVPPVEDFAFLDRITSRDEHHAWQNNHDPAYGVHPTSSWSRGTVLRESYILVAGAAPPHPSSAFLPVGGAYRRGDMIPVRLWMELAVLDEAGEPTAVRLPAVPPGPGQPGSDGDRSLLERVSGGYHFSADGLVLVGEFFVPTHPAARLPDDGRRISYDE